MGATWTSFTQITNAAGTMLIPYISIVGQLGVFAVIAAGAGIILRARWASAAAGIAALCQLLGIALLVSTVARFAIKAGSYYTTSVAIIGAGSLCALVAAVVAWRTARSSFGTLRDVLA